MKNQVKVSQVALILLVIIPGGKYLSLPAVMSQHAGRDSWFAIALLLLIDFLCFMAVLWAVKLNKNNLSLLTILDKSITKVGSKVVFAVMFLFSSARYVVLSCSGYDLINVTFAVNINWPVYAILVAAFTVFLVSRGFQTVGRVAQLMVGIVMLALLIIVISPLRSIEMDNLFPFLEDGFMPVLKAVDHDHFWFTDYLFVYFIMDKLADKKRLFAYCGSAMGIGTVLAIAMNVVFVALYGNLAPYMNLAMSKVSQFAMVNASSGRLDWLTLSVWASTIGLKLVVYAYTSYRCLEGLLEHKSKYSIWLSLTTQVVLVLPLFILQHDIVEGVGQLFQYPFMVVQYLLPLLLPLFAHIANKKMAGVYMLGGKSEAY